MKPSPDEYRSYLLRMWRVRLEDGSDWRADLGATWWLEAITPFREGKGFDDEWPVDAMRERILGGPPQLRKPL